MFSIIFANRLCQLADYAIAAEPVFQQAYQTYNLARQYLLLD